MGVRIKQKRTPDLVAKQQSVSVKTLTCMRSGCPFLYTNKPRLPNKLGAYFTSFDYCFALKI